MVRTTVKVLLRTRPTDSFASDRLRFLDDGHTVLVLPSNPSDGTSAPQDAVPYNVHQILHHSTQQHVYEACGAETVKAAMDGMNATILCYGQTGSGKTYTMMGGEQYTNRGLIPRIVKAIFDEMALRADRVFTVQVSVMEIYNEQLIDVLDFSNSEELHIQDDISHGGALFVRGLSRRNACSEEEALQHIFTGHMNRTVGRHGLNPKSSRGHCVYTIYLQSRTRIESGSAALVSKIQCMDLAGSERLSKSGSEGMLMREAQFINRSLSFLEHVVLSMNGQIRRSHVPYRQCKLTILLKDSLGGNCRTSMVANIWPEAAHLEETISTLKFSARIAKVQNEAVVNVFLDAPTQVRQLQRMVSELKSELHMQNQLHGKSHIQYEGEVSEDERYEMEKRLRDFLYSKLSPVPDIQSLREVKEYFRIMRSHVNALEAEFRAAGKDVSPGQQHSASITQNISQQNIATTSAHLTQQAAASQLPATVGAIEKSGHSLGAAAPARNVRDLVNSMKPQGSTGNLPPSRVSTPNVASVQAVGLDSTNSVDVMNASNQNKKKAIPMFPPLSKGHFTQKSTLSGASVRSPAELAALRNQAYEEYKVQVGEGVELYRSMKDAQEKLLRHRSSLQCLLKDANEVKHEIDRYRGPPLIGAVEKHSIIQTSAERGGESGHHTTEELELKKKKYRSLRESYEEQKTHTAVFQKAFDKARTAMLYSFESWFERYLLNVKNSGAFEDGTCTVENDVEEPLDEAERFAIMQRNRLMEEDPDSLAYYLAKKAIPMGRASARRRRVAYPHKHNPRNHITTTTK